MSSTFATGTAFGEGDIVIADVPFEEDRYIDKTRTAFVVGLDGGAVVIRGIYTNSHRDRRLIRATAENGLHHDSYIGARSIRVSRQRIHRRIGETPYDFDPFDDFTN